MGRRWTNAKTWASVHKPEILGITGTVLGIGAFGTAIYMTHKYGSDDYKALKASHAELVRQKNCGELSEDDFRKASMKNIGKGAGKLAKDYAIPVALEAGSIVCNCLAGNEYRGRIKNYATMAASAAATIAMMQDNIREQYGEDAVKKVMTIPKQRTIETKDEKGKKKKEVIELDDPELMCIDKIAYQDSIKYGLPYSPTRIRIDERFSIYNTCNGELYQMLFPLRTSYDMSNEQMWNDGIITVWDILKNIGMESDATKTINRSMAKRYGIINQPKAYDFELKKWVTTPGFKKNGVAERKDGLDLTHKRITFGDAIDAMLEDYEEFDIHASNPTHELAAVDEETGREYFYIDIGTDGDITKYRVEEQSSERKQAAWEQFPKTQQ